MNLTDTKSNCKDGVPSPLEVAALLDPYEPGEPRDLLVAYAHRLLRWDDARREVHVATVTGSVEDRLRAELKEEQAAASVAALRHHASCVYSFMARQALDPTPDLLAGIKDNFLARVEAVERDVAEIAEAVVRMRRGVAA